MIKRKRCWVFHGWNRAMVNHSGKWVLRRECKLCGGMQEKLG